MIICPICQKNDQLMKVASIVDYGTHNISGQTDSYVPGEYGGHWETVPISGTQRSELARKLALSPHPSQPSITFGTCLTWGLIFFILPAVIFVVGFICAAGVGNYYQQAITFFEILACAIPIILFIIYLIWFSTGRAKYSVEKPKWDRAWHVWNRLYFCFRDNKIYDPETGEAFDVPALNHYIFSK